MLSGFKGVRQLAAALADVHLRRMALTKYSYRKRGFKPPMKSKATCGREWLDGEQDEILMMRARGMSKLEIAQATGRSWRSIDRKCGHQPLHGVKHAHANSQASGKQASVTG